MIGLLRDAVGAVIVVATLAVVGLVCWLAEPSDEEDVW